MFWRCALSGGAYDGFGGDASLAAGCCEGLGLDKGEGGGGVCWGTACETDPL